LWHTTFDRSKRNNIFDQPLGSKHQRGWVTGFALTRLQSEHYGTVEKWVLEGIYINPKNSQRWRA
jgi:hypothetical protein